MKKNLTIIILIFVVSAFIFVLIGFNLKNIKSNQNKASNIKPQEQTIEDNYIKNTKTKEIKNNFIFIVSPQSL